METTVAIPLHKGVLDEYEKISLVQCLDVLKRHIFTIVTHRELDIAAIKQLFEEKGVTYSVVYFDKKWFASVDAYNRLVLSPLFYLRFLRYKYILIHQLDCFVFRDELDYWEKQDLSYVGAPWVRQEGYQNDGDGTIAGVGNGGFSLRNVRDHLRVLVSLSYLEKPGCLRQKIFSSSEGTAVGKALLFFAKLTFRNNTFFLFNDFHSWGLWEDAFWGRFASRFAWFKVPDWRIAAKFSVELDPARFINTSADLPFGCHAWNRYELDFWRPFIQSFGHVVDDTEDFSKE